ncbi:LemA family protein [Oceanispirochaeta crateris]|uniref:LemA family protein n=1 Tax=Oceanispirochaeta crateris TaxID=2518645 RepID=A0A5C1QFT0_9SPIO|nr:LemA family protein [Oceanispirochaeta crateris]QEN06915.1 LemA family protein [Oceanispirochaeta crateris]
MNKKIKTGWIILAVILVLILMGYGSFKGTYNNMVVLDESVSASWSQVENVYQRRMDLIPNLVNTVQGYASHEKETFALVTEARSKAGGTLQVSDDILNNPESFQRFQQAQSELGSALQRLMVISENYPELKADQNFLALQDQLEGTENRITVERKRFNESVQQFNMYIRQFPRVMIANMMGFDEKTYFQSSQGADQAPVVSFE